MNAPYCATANVSLFPYSWVSGASPPSRSVGSIFGICIVHTSSSQCACVRHVRVSVLGESQSLYDLYEYC